MGRIARVLKRTALAFYDDQMTHHAAALTYYTLMSLFPALLLGVSLLGLLGQYPGTYDAVIVHLRDLVPGTVVNAIDASLRSALRDKGTALTALALSLVTAMYGATGVLEAARRALNVVFEVEHGRSFLRRKLVDVGSALVLGVLVLATLLFIFLGGGLAQSVFDLLGIAGARSAWGVARWPAAVLVAMLVFAWVYYVTPDVHHRSWHWITPGAAVGVAAWLGASVLLTTYLDRVSNVTAVYGAFAAAIVLLFWLWLTNVALLFGAELDAEIEREKELSQGVPARETLNRPAKRA